MAAPVGLTDIPVADNHCHAVEAEQPDGVAQWRQYFSESPDPQMRTGDVAETAFYRRLLRRMAAFHQVPPAEADVLSARAAFGPAELAGALFTDARIESVVVDTGYPDPAGALGRDDFARASGAERADLLRLELLFQDLVAGCASYGELTDAVRHRLADVRGSGYAGFKSIAGYRTGLAIRRWPADEARAAYRAARDEVVRCGSVRLGYQPLLDTLLHVAFEAAAAQELPVQFHVGYGDPDADLRAAAPLELRDVLSEPGYRPMPVVLLALRQGGRLPGCRVRQRLPRPVVRDPVPVGRRDDLDGARRRRHRAGHQAHVQLGRGPGARAALGGRPRRPAGARRGAR